ncbi:hypothetical protein BJX99DRAFT_242248 [Aspergillus californicus]
MDEAMVNEDVRSEVDILIYDYMICMAIHRAISSELEIGLEDTIKMLKYLLPPTETFPADLQIKTQIFRIIQVLIKQRPSIQPEPVTLAELAKTFVLTCNTASIGALGGNTTKIAIQLCIHAAFQTYRSSNDKSMDEFMKHSMGTLGGQEAAEIPEYVSTTLLSIGVTFEAYFEAIKNLEDGEPTTTPISTALADIMKLLKPPVLTQLEMGKLDGLSRAETEELKRRVGM